MWRSSQKARQLDLGKTKLCAFGMTRRRALNAADDPGMKALVAAETPCSPMVGKTWDYHATHVLNVTLEENLAMIGESVQFLARHAN